MHEEYSRELKKIEAALQSVLPGQGVSSRDGVSGYGGLPWLEAVFSHKVRPALTEPLLEPLRDLFNRGGKRWRPLLAHLVCMALGGGDAALPLLPLVEFPHNASLIHDDLEDCSDERRGKAAIHLLYGNDTAINSGSFLYFLPLIVLENENLSAEKKNRIWRLWGEHMRLLHFGQSMDIAWHRSEDIPSLDDYMFMCGLKTGCLARFAALLGIEAAAGDTPPDSGLALLAGGAAQKLGVGFQILDDVKNLASGIPGKKRGDDIVEGKRSLPVLLFLHDPGLSPIARNERITMTLRCFRAARKGGTAVPELEELIAAMTESGALKGAEVRGRALIAEAGASFALLPVQDPPAGKLLAGLTELLG